jgi:conjugal transfer pilus assembly protein TraF
MLTISSSTLFAEPYHYIESRIKDGAQRCNKAIINGKSVDSPECGWYFKYIDKIAKDEQADEDKKGEALQGNEDKKKKDENKEDPCKTESGWTVSCGFVDPGRSFEFQKKQRDEIFKAVSMSPENTKIVIQLQKYMKWAIDKAITASRTAEFNRVQDPSLDASVIEPISSFGLRVKARWDEAQDRAVFNTIKELGGFFVFFTRTDCYFCKAMEKTMVNVSLASGIDFVNASLDENCLDGMVDYCETGEDAINVAKIFNSSVVPDIILTIPDEDINIRVAVGIVSTEEILKRVEQFFIATMRAIENQIGSEVDFRSQPEFLKEAARSGLKKSFD